MADLMTLVGKTYVVKTFGCQMNLHDSERVSGLLDQCGCICVDETDQADIVVFMTCCVRENADQRLYGQASAMVSAPKPPCGRRVVAIGGCIAQRDGEKIRKNIPAADVVFGTSALASLPELLAEAFADDGSVVEVDTGEEGRGFSADLPSRRSQRFHAWVPIMQGCNNFCTYCIVPYVRGGERSRKPEDILSEVRALVESGCREITLLGQNVNSYGKGSDFNCDFAELLRRISEIPGDFLLRFMTSHPKDASFRLIDIMAESPKIAHQFHLPVQSGSDRILKAMNRNYTREAYLSLIRYMRERMPDITITSDIIVGFPGETEEDFEDTLSILREVKYDMVYSFIYSKRRGTPAAQMENQVPDEVKSGRMTRLLARQNEISLEKNLPLVGRTLRVLVEGRSKTNPERFTGRTQGNKIVLFDGDDGMTGRFADIRITRAAPFTLWGEVESTDRSYKK